MAENPYSPAPGEDLGYAQLLAILLRRSTWLVGTLVSVLAIAGILTALEKPRYRSSMQLLIEPNYEQRLQESDQSFQPTDQQSEVDYATQLNLLRSNQFTQQAVASLKDEYPDLDVDDVHDALSLSQLLEDETNTKIFEVIYEDDDPTKTQRVVEALNQVYQKYNQEQQELRMERGLNFINDQLESVRNGLASSQTDLEEFRRRYNLINPEEQAEAVATALNTVIEEQQTNQAELNQARSRLVALQQQINLSPNSALLASRLTQSSRFQALLSSLQETEVELAQQQAIYTNDAPRVQTLLIQRDNTLSLVREEISRVLGGQATASDTALATGLSLGQLSEVDISQISALVQGQVELISLQARAASLAQTDRQLRTDLSRYPSLIAEFDRLQPTVEIERNILAQILQERQKFSADLSRGGFNWQLVEPPQAGEKISPNPVQNMMLGVVAGLFLGGVAAFIREAMDRVVRSPDLLNQQTGTPLLGILPDLEMDTRSSYYPFRKGNVPPTTASHSMLFREALDLIYKNIQLQSTTPFKSLVITSTLPAEGKTTFACGLAVSAARLHQRVLLIDADLRRPTLHERLQLSNEQGLTTALEGSAPHPQSLVIGGTSIDVLPAGPKAIDPVKLLSSRRMRDLMMQFATQYDLVLLDTPPVLGLVDAIEVASCCHGVVMVGRLDRITQAELTQAIAALRQLNVLGIVANGSRHYPKPYLEAIAHANRNGHASHPSILPLQK